MDILDPFMMKALCAGLGVAIVSGVVGCFIVWKRMAYFGDSLSHSALLGIVVGLMSGLPLHFSIIMISFLFSAFLVYLEHHKTLSNDTLLGILAHSALSFGMIALSLTGQNVDLHSFLFGDILTVSWSEISVIYIGGLIILGLMCYFWRSLLLVTINAELAEAEGVSVMRMNILLMGLITLIVSLSIKFIGALLITAMLIIPAATARYISSSPSGMAIRASILGSCGVICGIILSFYADIPSGPTIIAFSTIVFFIITGTRYVSLKR